MCEKRNQLISQAILDKLASGGMGVYTSEDILTVANIDEQDLNKILKEFQNDVADITRKEK